MVSTPVGVGTAQVGKAALAVPAKCSEAADGGVPVYKTWLDEDVIWIINAEEHAAFRLLKDVTSMPLR